MPSPRSRLDGLISDDASRLAHELGSRPAITLAPCGAYIAEDSPTAVPLGAAGEPTRG